jgi:hypothetical protein
MREVLLCLTLAHEPSISSLDKKKDAFFLLSLATWHLWLWIGEGWMQSHSIRQLDLKTTKLVQASLLYPTLTSIVLELIHHALGGARTLSRIQLLIQLAPEWQIACEYDERTDEDLGRSKVACLSEHEIESSALYHLTYLGLLDIQHGRQKLIQKVCIDHRVWWQGSAYWRHHCSMAGHFSQEMLAGKSWATQSSGRGLSFETFSKK